MPGAVFLDLDEDLCGPPGPGGRHPLPDPGDLERVLRRAGVSGDRPVVIYDHGDGLAAARAWWTLRWAGHPDVRVLDGGFPQWTYEVESGTVTPEEGDFVVRPGRMPVLDADSAAGVARTGVLIDARTADRFRGETEPIDPVAGHIPGAVNLPKPRLTSEDGRLLPPADLRAAFASVGVPAGSVGAYCGSGVTAAHTVLAMNAAGLGDAALYVGSWSNWIADPARPVATDG